ncbi:MAG TPA: hypothetical protein PLR60_04820, partial [Syntrophorhabdaceae bacterium]|nr:hypothetical protein [Syntrophorhabdaceae bacterium]
GVKKKIFIVTYGGGHVSIMIPIIRELMKDRNIELSILGLSIASEALRNEGIAHNTILTYKDLIMDENAWRFGKALAKKMHVEGKGISLEETTVYFGSSMRDMVEEKGEEEAFRTFRMDGKACFIPTRTMGSILDKEKPDLLITGNSPRMERAAMTAAHMKGIKVLSLNDLLGFDRKYIFPADKIAVISEMTRENLIGQGNPPENIVVTGSPVFDLIIDEKRTFNREEILKELALPPDARLFLLATQPQKESTWEMIDMMAALVKNYPEHYLVVKPHPGDDNRLYMDYLSKINDPRVVLAGMPVRKIIFVADLTVTIYSTVGLESMLMGVPLIQLNLMGIPNPIPLYRYGVCFEAKGYDELETRVNEVLNNKQTKESIARNINHYFKGIISGGGLHNCLHLVYEMLESV